MLEWNVDKAPMTQIIEGTWEELVRREDLRGRRLRVILLDNPTAPPASADAWIQRLRTWAAAHPPVPHPVDDSRDVIYGGTLDDPR